MLKRFIAGKFRDPTGLTGRLVGRLMARGNQRAGDWTVSLLGMEPDDRILEVLARRPTRDARAPVVAAIAHERPAVISPRANDVDLIAATWSLLGLPYFTGFGVDRQGVTVPMSDRINTGLVSPPPDKRVISGNAPVVAQPDDLTRVVVGILRASYLRT